MVNKLITSLIGTAFIATAITGTVNAAAINHTAPANLCSAYTRGELSADLKTSQGTATFINKSKKCSYKTGLMAYKVMIGMKKEEQQPFDYQWSYIMPGETITLKVNLPDCGYQVDPFEGEPLLKLGNTSDTSYKFSGRLLGAGQYHPTANGGPCSKTPTPTATPSPTSTPIQTQEATPPPTPTIPPKNEVPAELPHTGSTSPALVTATIGLLSAGMMYYIRRDK